MLLIDKRTKRDLNALVKQIKKPFVKDISFPRTPDANGMYPIIRNEVGKIRCPNCGACSFGIYEYSLIECETCFSKYIHYGVLGLEPQKVNDTEQA